MHKRVVPILLTLFFLGGLFIGLELRKVLITPSLISETGLVLDIDHVLLKNGVWLKGYVIEKNNQEILFKMPTQTLRISFNEIDYILYNYNTRYLKGWW